MRHLCPILGRETETEPAGFGRDGWSLVRCVETGMVFLPDPPAYEELESNYAWEATSAAERRRRLREEPVRARVSDAMKRVKAVVLRSRNKMADLALEAAGRWPAGTRLEVVDFGCAQCRLLLRTHERLRDGGYGCVPVGVEVSRGLAAQGDARLRELGGRVECASAIDGARRLATGSIHLALMSSFLEHEAKPFELLRELRRVLRPDGAVVIKVPNFACWNRALRGNRWCGFRYPDHVNYFTPTTLARLAAEAGYRVVRQRASDRVPTSDNMYAVLGPA